MSSELESADDESHFPQSSPYTDSSRAISSSVSMDFHFSSDDELDFRQPNPIQEIFTHRISQKGTTEYFIKLTGKSYRSCCWESENFLLAKGCIVKLKKYKKQHPFPPSPPFYDPSYEKIEKIIGKRGNNEYLIKWCNLDYDQITWENPATIGDDALIEAFNAKEKVPPSSLLQIPPRPNPSSWKTIVQPPKSNSGFVARDYQLEGLNFLTNCWYYRRNCILADEMGLGKTIQSTLFLMYLHMKEKIRGPFLIIVPLSTIPHWERELKEWSNLRCLSFIGKMCQRKTMKSYEFYYDKTSIPKFEVLLTTYESVIRETELQKISWQCIIVDEAHRLKNADSKLINSLRSYRSDFKLLLTGTPIQNKTQELWSLLHFLDSARYGTLADFEKKFANCNETNSVLELQTILKPIMLRRLKSDVEDSIAPLEEVIIDCPMTMHQKAYYKAIFLKNIDYLRRGAHSKANAACLRNISMDLRKACNHPYLIKNAEDQILIERKEVITDHGSSDYVFVNESLIRSSGKMILLDKLLAKLKADGHRVLIFSQMKKMLDILQDYLNYRHYTFERIDGSIKSKERQESIDKFNDPNSEDFVFLLCTKAGGVGINLASADTVIIYDSDWNPQNDIQATARCHRIGQTKDVKAYRFITANSYERQMFETASKKLGLDRAVLESSKIHDQEYMDKLIRLGAYHALEDDGAETEQFGEEDIDMIISRSQKIRHESLGYGVSTFAKAEFKIEEEESVPVALYKPEFWKKYLPNDNMSFYDSTIDELSIAERRLNLRIDSSRNEVYTDSDDEIPFKGNADYWNKSKFSMLQNQLWRFGFTRFDKILHNGKLDCDQTEIRAVCHVVLGWLISSCSEERVIANVIYKKIASRDTLAFEQKFKKKKAEYESQVVNGFQWKLKRAEILYFLDQLIKTSPSVPDEIIIPEILITPPAPWWSKKHDQYLLLFIWQNGYQQFNDVIFEDHDPIPSKELKHRFNTVINSLKDLYFRYKENQPSERKDEIQFGHQILVEALSAWTMKEHRTLLHYLLNFGYPNATKFREISCLTNKTDEMIDLYVKDVIRFCEQSVEFATASSQAAMNNENGNGENKDPIESIDLSSIKQPDKGLLIDAIPLGSTIRILSRLKFFERTREVERRTEDLSEFEAQLIHHISERGFLNLSECQLLTQELGPDATSEGKVIKKIKSITKRFFVTESSKSRSITSKPISASLINSIAAKLATLSSNNPNNSSSHALNEESYSPNSASITPLQNEATPFSLHNLEDCGNPSFPLQLSPSLALAQLGTVIYDREGFHNKRYLYPDGFISERLYNSIENPNEKVWYQSMILDRGGDEPVFRVQLKENPSVFFEGASPSNPWLVIVKAVNKAKVGAAASAMKTVSGPEFYGLSNPMVQLLMRKMENADRCSRFDLTKCFATTKSRTAAVVQNVLENKADMTPENEENSPETQEKPRQIEKSRPNQTIGKMTTFDSTNDLENVGQLSANTSPLSNPPSDDEIVEKKIQKHSINESLQALFQPRVKSQYNAPSPLLIDFDMLFTRARNNSKNEDVAARLQFEFD